MDVLGDFLDQECDRDPDAEVGATALYQKYKEWCERSGERARSQKWFGGQLTERGFNSSQGTKGSVKGLRRWEGLRLMNIAC